MGSMNRVRSDALCVSSPNPVMRFFTAFFWLEFSLSCQTVSSKPFHQRYRKGPAGGCDVSFLAKKCNKGVRSAARSCFASLKAANSGEIAPCRRSLTRL